jgi:hypothetical protein
MRTVNRTGATLVVAAVVAVGLAACSGPGSTRADPGRSPILPSSSSWGWDAGASASPTGRHLDKGETPPSPNPGGGTGGSGSGSGQGGGDPLAGPVCSALRLARRALTDAVDSGGPTQATGRELTSVLNQLATGAASYATAGRSSIAVHLAQLVGALARLEGAVTRGDAEAILEAGSEATELIVNHFTGPNADVRCS